MRENREGCCTLDKGTEPKPNRIWDTPDALRMAQSLSSGQPEPGYVDTNSDLFLDCGLDSGSVQCALATLLGVLSAYVLPLMFGLCLVSNGLVMYVCAARLRLKSCFSVYLCAFCLCDSVQSLVWGFAWVFPARGVPYMTRGRSGFISMNQSDTACKVARYAQAFTSVCVIIVLLAGAVDRWLSVFSPLRMHRVTRNHAIVGVLACVAAATLVSLPTVAITGHTRVTYQSGNASISLILCGILDRPKSTGYYAAMVYRLLVAGDSSVLFITPALAVNTMLTCRIVAVIRQRGLSVGPNPDQQPAAAMHRRRSWISREEISASMSVILITLMYFLACIPKIVGIRGLYDAMENPDAQVVTRFLINVHDISDLLLQWTGSLTVVIVFKQIKAFRQHLKAILRCS